MFFQSFITPIPKGWLPLFGKPGWRRAENLVGGVRKWWVPHAMRRRSSCHEQYLLMPWGIFAHGICRPPFSNVVHHLFSTSASTFFERRHPCSPKAACLAIKNRSRQSNALSIFQSNIAVLSLENFSFAVWKKTYRISTLYIWLLAITNWNQSINNWQNTSIAIKGNF